MTRRLLLSYLTVTLLVLILLELPLAVFYRQREVDRLTVDTAGRRAGTTGFDPRQIRQWGYNAANDLQGINLNYIGSAGGVFSDGDRFAFDNPQAVTALGYVIE